MFERYDPRNYDIAWRAVGEAAMALGLAVLVAWVLYRVAYAVASRFAARTDTHTDDMLVERMRHPVKWLLIAIAITLAAESDPALSRYWEPVGQFLRPALLGWMAFSMVQALTAALELRLDFADDPVAVRSHRTRIAILSRTALVAIIVITVGLMLFAFPAVKDIGVTLLASAGLVALAVGAAAQPALKSLIAGLQVAITEPMRLGDMVKIEGEVGRVEEIHMAFVIVRTWDERALVVPTAKFLDSSFENWSRKNEQLSGPVYLHLDPATDVAPVRAEFERFVRANPLWDGRTAQLLMTEAHPESIELRLTASARTISDLWSLRCAVREHMQSWLRAEMPGALIRHRLEVEAANARASG